MNKKTMYWTGGIIALIIILLAAWAAFGRNGKTKSDVSQADPAAGDNLSSYLKEQDALMSEMMEDMMAVEPAGNAALDFLTGMIPHHQAAVSMSESYLKYGGSDDELRRLAESIIQTQKQEIEQMQTFIDRIRKEDTQDYEQEEAYLDAYGKMMSAHHSSHGTSGDNVEAAFADGMIMHHQMAVDMAQAILGNTDDSQVTSLAENIINVQKEEIAQMQGILKRVSSGAGSHH